MAAIEDLVFSPKFLSEAPNYQNVNIDNIKKKIQQRGQEAIRTTGIKKDAIDIKKISQQLGSEAFLKEYTDVLTTMLKELNKQDPLIPSNFFSLEGDSSFSMTELTEDQLATELDQVISTLRASIKIAFPGGEYPELDKLIGIADNQTFLEKFTEVVEKNKDKKGWENIGALHGHILGLSNNFAELKNPDSNKTEILKKFNSNLKNTWGQIIWERIAMIAREKVIKKYLDAIKDELIFPDQQTNIGTISIRVTSEQVGAKKSDESKKQEVADSLVKIEIINNQGTVIATIETGDSTKFKQNASTGGIHFSPTTNQSIMHTLDQLLASVQRRTYWKERLKIYLDGTPSKAKKAEILTEDNTNWQNTYEAFYRLALYDVLAVRATGSQGLQAQTLTINNKIKMISQIIIDIPQQDIINRSTKTNGNIFTLADNAYGKYVEEQWKTSYGWRYSDEGQLFKNYNNFIQQILNTKITISRNVSYYSLSHSLT